MTRVIIADDHPFLRSGVEGVLRAADIEVLASVADGTAALAAIVRTDPDIAILDVEMPGLDGVTVLETIREGGDLRPVVLLTASLDDDRLVRAIKAGVNGIVLKEGAEETLLTCLEEVRRGQRSVDPTVLQRAQRLARAPAPADPLAPLTPRERDVALAAGKGLRNRDVAAALGMTEGSVKVCLHRIYDKLGLQSRTELALLVSGGA